jgi:hypothetical protein
MSRALLSARPAPLVETVSTIAPSGAWNTTVMPGATLPFWRIWTCVGWRRARVRGTAVEPGVYSAGRIADARVSHVRICNVRVSHVRVDDFTTSARDYSVPFGQAGSQPQTVVCQDQYRQLGASAHSHLPNAWFGSASDGARKHRDHASANVARVVRTPSF